MKPELKAAIELYTGWGCYVFPLPLGDKRPGVPWKDIAVNTTDAALRLFEGRGDCWIAVVTGLIETGKFAGKYLSVVDIDTKDEKVGADSWHKLTAEHGPEDCKFEVITSSGGRHLYYIDDNSLTFCRGVRQDIDFIAKQTTDKGKGAYVVAPPSFNAAYGRAYEFEAGNEEYPGPLPKWLLKIKQAEKPAVSADPSAPPPKIMKGQRDEFLFRQGSALRAKGLGEDQIYILLSEINKHQCVPPLSDKEVHEKAKSAAKYALPEEFEPTDLWIAENILPFLTGKVCHCPEIGWMTWDKKWSKTYNDHIFGLVSDQISHLKSLCPDKEALKFYRRCLSAGRIASIVKFLTAKLHVPHNAFDKMDHHFNCQNGLLDLKTGKLLPHDPTQYLTKISSVCFDPAATCPVFDTFILEILGAASTVNYINALFGYSLCADISLQKLHIFHGTGLNGKSTLLKAAEEVFGEYFATAPESLIMETRNQNEKDDLAFLYGLRLILVSETKDGVLSEAAIKRLTSTEPVVACYKYKDQFRYSITYKVIQTTNPEPELRGTDLGIKRRIAKVFFGLVVEHPDHALPEKLKKEAPGILNRWLAGYQYWHVHRSLPPCPAIDAANETFFAEEDKIGTFIRENCATAPDNYVLVNAFKNAIQDWNRYIPARKVDKYMKEKFVKVRLKDRANNDHRDRWVYVGLSLLDDHRQSGKIGQETLDEIAPF